MHDADAFVENRAYFVCSVLFLLEGEVMDGSSLGVILNKKQK